MNAVTLTQCDLEDLHRGDVGSQTGQTLLPTTPDANQQAVTSWRLQDSTDSTADDDTTVVML